jgi:hypothetical protein
MGGRGGGRYAHLDIAALCRVRIVSLKKASNLLDISQSFLRLDRACSAKLLSEIRPLFQTNENQIKESKGLAIIFIPGAIASDLKFVHIKSSY